MRLNASNRYHIALPRSSLFWSIALHAVLLGLAAQVIWTTPVPHRQPSGSIIWLANWPPPQTNGRAPPAPPSTPQTEKPYTSELPNDAAEPKDNRKPEESRAPHKSDSSNTAPALKQKSTISQRQPKNNRNDTNTSLTPAALPPDVDWYGEMHRAIDQLSKERHRYRTFSLDDVQKIPPPKDPDAWHDVLGDMFDNPSPDDSHALHLLSVGHAHTRIGRALTSLCNTLTGGGIGIGFGGFTLGTACANINIGPDLDSPIRPDTLKWLPDCAPVPSGKKPLIPELGLADTGMKCRLRPRNEPVERASPDPQGDAPTH